MTGDAGKSDSTADHVSPAYRLSGQLSLFPLGIILHTSSEEMTQPKHLLSWAWFVEVAGFHRCISVTDDRTGTNDDADDNGDDRDDRSETDEADDRNESADRDDAADENESDDDDGDGDDDDD